MLTISVGDLDVIQQLRKPEVGSPVLQSLKGHRLDQRNGMVLISCGDGDQAYDMFTRKVSLQSDHREHPRIQLYCDNGAPSRLPHNSPASPAVSTYALELLNGMKFVMEQKGMETVALCSHVPCVHAQFHGLSVLDLLTLMVAAKDRIREHCAPFAKSIACFLHIDYKGEKGKKTYFVNRDELRRFTESSRQFSMVGT